MFGSLVPLQGGDPFPLDQERMTIGRKPGNDIVLPHPNVSSRHCELIFNGGSWLLIDNESTNGVQVNEVRVIRKRLRPGDHVTIARKHHFRIHYTMTGNFDDDDELHERAKAKQAPPEMADSEIDELFSSSLLERAGLETDSSPAENDGTFNDEEEDENNRRAKDF